MVAEMNDKESTASIDRLLDEETAEIFMPDETWVNVYSYLDIDGVINMMAVSHQHANIAELFIPPWERLCEMFPNDTLIIDRLHHESDRQKVIRVLREICSTIEHSIMKAFVFHMLSGNKDNQLALDHLIKHNPRVITALMSTTFEFPYLWNAKESMNQNPMSYGFGLCSGVFPFDEIRRLPKINLLMLAVLANNETCVNLCLEHDLNPGQSLVEKHHVGYSVRDINLSFVDWGLHNTPYLTPLHAAFAFRRVAIIRSLLKHLESRNQSAELENLVDHADYLILTACPHPNNIEPVTNL